MKGPDGNGFKSEDLAPSRGGNGDNAKEDAKKKPCFVKNYAEQNGLGYCEGLKMVYNNEKRGRERGCPAVAKKKEDKGRKRTRGETGPLQS